MKIISVIEDRAVNSKILKHLGLWEIRLVGRSVMCIDSNHDPHAVSIPHPIEFTYDNAYSQFHANDYYF